MSHGVRTLVVWCRDWPLVAAGVALDVPAVVLHANRVVATLARGPGRGGGGRAAPAGGPEPLPPLELLAHDPARDARAFEAVAGAVEAAHPPGGDDPPRRLLLPHPRPVPLLRGRRGPGPPGQRRGPGGRWPTRAAPGGGGRRPLRRRPRRPRAASSSRRGDARPSWPRFPVGVLEDPSSTSVLVRLGIATLADLAALPRSDLVARFGGRGSGPTAWPSGDDARLPDTRRPPPDLVAAELDPPAERVDAAAFAAKRWPTTCTSAWPAGAGLRPGRWWRPRPSTASATSAAGATRGR